MSKMIILIIGLILLIGVAYALFFFLRGNSGKNTKRKNDIDFLTVTQSLKKNVETWATEDKNFTYYKTNCYY